MDDFDHVAVGEGAVGVAAAGDDVAVDLDRDPAAGQALGVEQGGQRAGGVENQWVAIEADAQGGSVHAGIVARCPLPAQSEQGPCHT